METTAVKSRSAITKWLVFGLLIATVLCVGVASAYIVDDDDGLIILTGEDNGTTVDIPQAQDTYFCLALPETPTTGNVWVVSTSNGLNMYDAGYVENESDEDIDGVSGQHLWLFWADTPEDKTIIGVNPEYTKYTVGIHFVPKEDEEES